MAMAMAEREAEPVTVKRSLEGLLADWDGEEVVSSFDPVTGAWMFICIHSTLLGPAVGGTRMRVYPGPAEAAADAMRLSAAMTSKLAVAGLPFGGAKAVLAVPEIPEGAARLLLMHRYGALINSLKGSFLTGQDMNTSEQDIDLIAEVSPYAVGRSRARGGPGTPAPGTAMGILHGIRVSVARAFGSPDLKGRLVLVQGVGGVGALLAGLLTEWGARVLVSDIDWRRALALADRIGAEVIAPDGVIGTPCDVFAPCAVGGMLNEETIPRLRCRVVAGAANNQLATEDDAERLRAAGILYAPDYVINAGGVIQALGVEAMGWSKADVDRRLAGIGDTLARIYEDADAEGITTAAAAARLADERLRGASRGGRGEYGTAPGGLRVPHPIAY